MKVHIKIVSIDSFECAVDFFLAQMKNINLLVNDDGL